MGNSQGSYELSKKPIDDGANEDRALGIGNCSIPASRITASSSADDGPAFFARLNGSKSWCAGHPADCFLEVDLDTVHLVAGVATQGNPSGNHDYVKKYKIQYSIDGMEWEFYKENYKEVLDGNIDHNGIVRRKLDPSIKARYVRFWPTAWFQWPCLRVEVYGRPAPQENSKENGLATIKENTEEKTPEKKEELPVNDIEEEKQTDKETEKQEVRPAETLTAKDREEVEDTREKGTVEEWTREWKDEEWKYEREITENLENGTQEEDVKRNLEYQKEIEELIKAAEEERKEELKFTNEREDEFRTQTTDEFTTRTGENKTKSGDERDFGEMEKYTVEELRQVRLQKDDEQQRVEENSGQQSKEDQETAKDIIDQEINMEFLDDITTVKQGAKAQNNDVTTHIFVTSTPAKPTRQNVNKVNVQETTINTNDADLKRLMDVKARLEVEALKNGGHGNVQMRKKKRVVLDDEPVELVYVPRRIYDDMWGDSPTNSLSEGLDAKDEKPLIEIQDGGAPLAKHEDDVIEDAADHQGMQTVTIRTVKTIRTRIERHDGRAHYPHTDSDIISPSTSNVSHDAAGDLFSSLNGFNQPMTYAAQASCEHLHPTDPVVQVAMESSFNERYDSMDQINIDALASRRFSGLDLLQSPYDAVSGEDIQRLLAWEDEMLPGWTRMKKSRDCEIFKGTAVDGGPPIIKVVITLKKMAYEEVVRRITDWKVRQEWDKTFDKITLIEQSYNFNVVHCSIKNRGITLAVLDDVDIDEPFHASVWSVADHPDGYSLSTGKPLRYETMVAGLVIRPLTPRDEIPWTKVTLLYQIKGSVSPPLRATYLTGTPDKWIDMLKKYSPVDKKPVDKSPVEKKPGDKKAAAKKPHVKKVTI